jgi:hypothetical protein
MPEDDDDGTNCARMYNLNRPNPPPLLQPHALLQPIPLKSRTPPRRPIG